MTRKIVDCRDVPSESGCTLAITGEEGEVMEAAVAHAVAVHGHTDDDALRAGIRGGMRDAPLDTAPGAFVQVIEFGLDDLEEWDKAADEWLRDIGPERTAQWFVLGSDRESPGTYVEFVEFPSYDDAMTNSKHPATAAIAERMTAMSRGEVKFRNLDIVRTHMA